LILLPRLAINLKSFRLLDMSVATPPTLRQADERLIKLTPSAGVKVKALAERETQGRFLRAAISGGGCNGLSYKLRFVGESKEGDILVNSAGVDVLVDPKSALYLRGTVLDYSDKMIGGGFKFSNPNAKASCSCGESFSL
jgi:iron-sulfur cluster assembly protein